MTNHYTVVSEKDIVLMDLKQAYEKIKEHGKKFETRPNIFWAELLTIRRAIKLIKKEVN